MSCKISKLIRTCWQNIFSKEGNGKEIKGKESKVGANSNQLIWLSRLVQLIVISWSKGLTKWNTKVNYGHKIRKTRTIVTYLSSIKKIYVEGMSRFKKWSYHQHL
jgi:hypothetical protein